MGGRKVSIFLILFQLLLCFHVKCESNVRLAPMKKEEQEGLYSMIQGFVGEWWNGFELYPDPCGWTPIQGISCDIFNGSWYVTSICIGPLLENSLQCSHSAKFSSYLFKLKHLQSLSFFNCFSSPMTLPSEDWRSLSQTLETLEFHSNQGLIGDIPPSISLLVNLRSLVLVDNSLSGQIPQELGYLFHLKRLTISGNRLSGQIPTSLGKNLTSLLILDLSRNSLSGPLHSSICGLTSLLKLDVSNNLLNGTLPREIGYMKSLILLDLRNNNLSGGLTQSLEQMVSIQDMLLSNNPIGGSLNEFGWEKLVNLKNLELSNMGLIGEIPHSIEKLRKLRFLALDNNKLSGSISSRLGDLPCLNALYFNGNNFSGEILFSEDFYGRVGMRFACWANPGLCYREGNGPVGVEKCKSKQEEVFDSKNKVSKGYIEENFFHSSSSGSFCICLVDLMQVMLVISVMLL